MPNLTPQQRNRLIAASGALAAIIGVAAFNSGDHSARVNAALSDAGTSRTQGAERTTDLLTEPVEPGATIQTGVTLPPGSAVTDVSGPGMFEIVEHVESVRHGGDVWCLVTVRNRTGAPMRFVGFVTFTVGGD